MWIVDGYVVEGQVPAADVAKLLAERPQTIGLAVGGMPLGEAGGQSERYEVIAFDAADRTVSGMG